MNSVGDYGNPAHLRLDAQSLAAAVQQAIAGYGGKQYLAAQQAGMKVDTSWESPAQEWEQVCKHSQSRLLSRGC